MNTDALEKILSGQPPFRLKTAKQLIYKNLIETWDGASSLPQPLRRQLTEKCPLNIDAVAVTSTDKKTIKALITLDDGLKIESVLMQPPGGRFTVCVSSQAGCPLNCVFCATGRLGFKRNLTVTEIVEQVIYFARYLKKQNHKVTNVVFMGMGEPFLNYDNVIEALKIINDNQGLNIGARHLAVSTSGVVPGILRFSKEPLQFNLAVSLHSPTDDLRSTLMPVNDTYPLGALIGAVSEYIDASNRKVMFEYLMLDGINDSEENAHQLTDLLKTIKKPLYMVNLIRYNATGIFKPSKEEAIKAFKDILQTSGIETTRRYSFGEDIEAACGQLAARS